MTLPVYIYETAFSQFRLSRAAAMSVIASAFLLTFAVLFTRFAAPNLDEE
jgi:multiple sugar transport system permease protein